jgi:hypothetical protein
MHSVYSQYNPNLIPCILGICTVSFCVLNRLALSQYLVKTPSILPILYVHSDTVYVPKIQYCGEPGYAPGPEPGILKHLVEAEKPTFQGKLPFQRSECTAGLKVATIFCCDCENYFL